MVRKSYPIQISVPTPCSQSWDEMTPDAQGRYCAHCQKPVIDFTGWSDTMLYEFFTKSREPVCGRFQLNQLNRTIKIPPQPHSKLYRVAITLGLTILVAQTQDAYARVQPPLTQQAIIPEQPGNDSTTADSIRIKGIVLDEHKEPMIGAMVAMEVSGKELAIAATDITGYFEIPISRMTRDTIKSQAILQVRSVGYTGKDIPVYLHDISFEYTINMSLSTAVLGGLRIITVESEHRPPLPDQANPGKKVFTRKDIHNMGY